MKEILTYLVLNLFTDISNNDAFVKMVNTIKKYSKKRQKNHGLLNYGLFILNTFTLSGNL